MSTTIGQFNAIKEFLRANPDGNYEQWYGQYKPTREKKKVEFSEEFEKWWLTFPAGMSFTFKGRKFTGTRALRDDKTKTFKAYELAKKATKFSDTDMLHCLEVEIQSRKLASYNHKNPSYNDFQFMKATIAYLNSGKFVYWREEVLKRVPDTEDVSFNAIDI